MVSLRRRKLLGFCTGVTSPPRESPNSREDAAIVESSTPNVKSIDVHPVPSSNIVHAKQEQVHIPEADLVSSNLSGSSSSKEEPIQQYPVPEVKRRKRHRRKHIEDREPCIMRGVYFKNMKWQAAIKVDKKQIHLGTVGSQEEAARLYDRAAFMCGREPNFVLSEEEKQELQRFKWDEFLAMTRNAINNKKSQRRIGAATRRKSEARLPHGDWENDNSARASSASDDMDGGDT